MHGYLFLSTISRITNLEERNISSEVLSKPEYISSQYKKRSTGKVLTAKLEGVLLIARYPVTELGLLHVLGIMSSFMTTQRSVFWESYSFYFRITYNFRKKTEVLFRRKRQVHLLYSADLNPEH